MTRRELLERAGFVITASAGSSLFDRAWVSAGALSKPPNSIYEWIRSPRIVIAEGYNPPFYPSFDYAPEKALAVTRQLNADALRFPAAAYFAFFPTKTKYPIHPELGARDPLGRTVELFHEAGLKVIAYNPLNHPFMDVNSKNPDYENWVKRDVDGRPMVTPHYGFTRYFEGCLNSPLRAVIQAMVREVLTNYPVDLMYFDGPYQGMRQSQRFCHCRYCKAAYETASGKSIPLQDGTTTLEDEIEYRRWMAEKVVIAFLREIREMIRQTRDVPVLYNDTSLLSKREWRARGFRAVDGFMFEAAHTPEQKLFNMQLGHSTGKVIWTYLSSHTEYNREHLKDKAVRGWFSYPLEAQELLLDGAVAMAGGAGLCYWGLSRFFYMPKEPLAYESGRYIKEIFDLAKKHPEILGAFRAVPQAGILVGSQTIDWYRGAHFVEETYANYYYGAYQLLKDIGYDAEPFLDYEITSESLAKYKLLYIPNAPCLSEGQCAVITKYVEEGGALVATHLTSLADEVGRGRGNFGLADLFGARAESAEPQEIPDLYLHLLPSRELIPQDPQVVLFKAAEGAMVIAETYDRGHRRTLGPAVVTRGYGQGRVIYIGSGLEAVYQETLSEPLRAYFASLLGPILRNHRSYEVDFRRGLMPHLTASSDAVLLHLLANTGDKWKKLFVREAFLPETNVKVRIRVSQGRKVRSVSLLRSEQKPSWMVKDGWIELTVPLVLIHEAVRVELS